MFSTIGTFLLAAPLTFLRRRLTGFSPVVHCPAVWTGPYSVGADALMQQLFATPADALAGVFPAVVAAPAGVPAAVTAAYTRMLAAFLTAHALPLGLFKLSALVAVDTFAGVFPTCFTALAGMLATVVAADARLLTALGAFFASAVPVRIGHFSAVVAEFALAGV